MCVIHVADMKVHQPVLPYNRVLTVIKQRVPAVFVRALPVLKQCVHYAPLQSKCSHQLHEGMSI